MSGIEGKVVVITGASSGIGMDGRGNSTRFADDSLGLGAVCRVGRNTAGASVRCPLQLSPAPSARHTTAAFVNVSTGFCIPSFSVRRFFGKAVCE
jgi:hypothetical protein